MDAVEKTVVMNAGGVMVRQLVVGRPELLPLTARELQNRRACAVACRQEHHVAGNNRRGRVDRRIVARAPLHLVAHLAGRGIEIHETRAGQEQRVAIARALVTDPAILLADEPTGNLDSESSQEIMRLLVELNQQGRTIVLITHEPDIAIWARRVVRLRDGLVLSDEPQPAPAVAS